MQKNHTFQELTDDQLDQVTGGGNLLGTATQTLGDVTSLIPNVQLPLAAGVNLQVKTPVADVCLGLGTETKLGL